MGVVNLQKEMVKTNKGKGFKRRGLDALQFNKCCGPLQTNEG